MDRPARRRGIDGDSDRLRARSDARGSTRARLDRESIIAAGLELAATRARPRSRCANWAPTSAPIPTAIYRHFRSKEHLMQALLDELTSRSRRGGDRRSRRLARATAAARRVDPRAYVELSGRRRRGDRAHDARPGRARRHRTHARGVLTGGAHRRRRRAPLRTDGIARALERRGHRSRPQPNEAPRARRARGSKARSSPTRGSTPSSTRSTPSSPTSRIANSSPRASSPSSSRPSEPQRATRPERTRGPQPADGSATPRAEPERAGFCRATG